MSNLVTKDKIIQNLKIITIMKSCGKTDREIAKYLGIGVGELLETIGSDMYLTEVYEKAQDKLASDIEVKFIENVLTQLEEGDNTDAKWILERVTKKYQKTDKHDVTIRSIDDIILERGEKETV